MIVGRAYEFEDGGRVKLLGIEPSGRLWMSGDGMEFSTVPWRILRFWTAREREHRAFNRRHRDAKAISDQMREALL